MKSKKYNKDLIPLSRTLRKNLTKEEKHLWYDFLKPHPMNFYRQKVVGKYIADFYCPQANLVIELDGSQHYTEEGLKNDEERTAFLSTYGLKVIRFTNGEIRYKFKYVCDCINQEIDEALKQKNKQSLYQPHPPQAVPLPLPGEGLAVPATNTQTTS